MRAKKQIKRIAEKYNFSLVLIFGSQITKKTHPNSDLDIAVLAKEVLNAQKHSQALFDIAEVFPDQKIDLVFINLANPLLLRKILENCKLIYGSTTNLNNLRIYSFKKYCDYKKYFDLEEKFVHNFLSTFK